MAPVVRLLKSTDVQIAPANRTLVCCKGGKLIEEEGGTRLNAAPCTQWMGGAMHVAVGTGKLPEGVSLKGVSKAPKRIDEAPFCDIAQQVLPRDFLDPDSMRL